MPPRAKRKTPEEVDVLIGGGIRYDVRMGKKLGLVVVGALLLTGCASGEPEAAPAPTVTVTATPEAAPIQVQAVPTEEAQNPEVAYVEAVKENWYGEPPTNEELISAGLFACEQYPTVEHYTEITAVQGEDWQAQDNNLRVVVTAGRTLCPEFDPSA